MRLARRRVLLASVVDLFLGNSLQFVYARVKLTIIIEADNLISDRMAGTEANDALRVLKEGHLAVDVDADDAWKRSAESFSPSAVLGVIRFGFLAVILCHHEIEGRPRVNHSFPVIQLRLTSVAACL